jgi:hypothetical protein
MSRELSKLQRDIITAATANGGTLTYREAYALFIPFKHPVRLAWGKGMDELEYHYYAQLRKFASHAERIRHTMRRLIRRGIAENYFSPVHMMRIAIHQTDSETRGGDYLKFYQVKASGVRILSVPSLKDRTYRKLKAAQPHLRKAAQTKQRRHS